MVVEEFQRRVYFEKGLFPRHIFYEITQHCNLLDDSLLNENLDIAPNRLFTPIGKGHALNSFFCSRECISKIERVLSLPRGSLRRAHDIPIEYRVYGVGSYMHWHKDTWVPGDRIRPQLEIVFTVKNTSDSKTRWIDVDGTQKDIWTPPNSILITQAHGVRHAVHKTTRGERSIVKVAYDFV